MMFWPSRSPWIRTEGSAGGRFSRAQAWISRNSGSGRSSSMEKLREGVILPRRGTRHRPARIFRERKGLGIPGMYGGRGLGHDVPRSEAGLPSRSKIERGSVDHGLDDRRPALVGEQAQDLGNPQRQVEGRKAGEQPGLPPGSFVKGRLGIPARQQNDISVAEVLRIGVQGHFREESLPAETVAEERHPTDLDAGCPACAAREEVLKEPLGAGPLGAAGFRGGRFDFPEPFHSHAIRGTARCEAGGPDELSTPLDPVLSLGSGLTFRAGCLRDWVTGFWGRVTPFSGFPAHRGGRLAGSCIVLQRLERKRKTNG